MLKSYMHRSTFLCPKVWAFRSFFRHILSCSMLVSCCWILRSLDFRPSQLRHINYMAHLNQLCWKYPRHVLGTGTYPKSQGLNWMASHIFRHILLSHVSAACPQSQSHVLSSTRNKNNSQINQIFWIFIQMINSIPLCKLWFPNPSFAITIPISIPKWK